MKNKSLPAIELSGRFQCCVSRGKLSLPQDFHAAIADYENEAWKYPGNQAEQTQYIACAIAVPARKDVPRHITIFLDPLRMHAQIQEISNPEGLPSKTARPDPIYKEMHYISYTPEQVKIGGSVHKRELWGHLGCNESANGQTVTIDGYGDKIFIWHKDEAPEI